MRSSCDKILLIGINPSNISPDNSAFHKNTKSGKILREWLGDTDIDRIYFMNLSADKNANIKQLKRSDFEWRKILNETSKYTKIVAIGSLVSDVLSDLRVPHFKMDHPSGLNRKLNDKTYLHERVRAFREFIG